VAGEIDVPTPIPPLERDRDTPAVEFTAAGPVLGTRLESRAPRIDDTGGPSESPDPDTGSRTPPLERR